MISLEKIIFIETQNFLSVRLDKIVINKRYMQRKCVHVYRAVDLASRATFYVVQGALISVTVMSKYQEKSTHFSCCSYAFPAEKCHNRNKLEISCEKVSYSASKEFEIERYSK